MRSRVRLTWWRSPAAPLATGWIIELLSAAPAGALLDDKPRTTVSLNNMEVQLTAVFRAVPEGFIAFVEELPGANTQGATLDEARENLREAVALVLEANRALALEDLGGADVIREPLKVTA